MDKTVYVAIDSNIFIRGWTQGKPGCEIDHWRGLQSKVDAGEVTILVPEVVTLECEKQWQVSRLTIDKHLKDAKSKITDWFMQNFKSTEIEDIGESLRAEVESLHKKKTAMMNANREEQRKLLNFASTIKLPYSQKLWFYAHKRLLSGNYPNAEDRNNNPWADCAIIETFEGFFADKNLEECQLLFCSENLKDFGIQVGAGKYTLHPLLKDGFPLTEIFLDLRSMMKFILAGDEVTEPSEEDVQEAFERELDSIDYERLRKIVKTDVKTQEIQLTTLQMQVLGLIFANHYSSGDGCTFRQLEMKLEGIEYDETHLALVLDALIEKGLLNVEAVHDAYDNHYLDYTITNDGKKWCRDHSASLMAPQPSQARLKPSTFAGRATDDDDIPF
ncbi:PIN domain-containing protein [Tundrisphaera sp. TA3]|uniref:PIN domain-containing protein n=1 Tax=Tundrisphaera sp. TA3 TaxID=3435775 RepID=UPI003EBC4C9D